MTRRNDDELRIAYPDLLAQEADEATIRAIRNLDTYYRVELPPAVRLRGLWARVGQDRGLPAARAPWRGSWRGWAQGFVLALVCTALIVAASGATATDNPANLGPPTNSVSQFLPLGSFRRISAAARDHGRAEVLFIGTRIDGQSAVERWPVVKALEQFGIISGLVPSNPVCCNGEASFDWTHVKYRSRYVAFVHKDVLDRNLRRLDRLSPFETKLFNKYLRLPLPSGYSSSEIYQVTLHNVNGPREFPLLLVGHYLQTSVGNLFPGDFDSILPAGATPAPSSMLARSYAAIHSVLEKGYGKTADDKALVYDFNVETNIISALICHADRLQPRSVCSRPAIRRILRHVK